MTIRALFHTIDEPSPGPKLGAVYAARADAYAAWYLQDGDQFRPTREEAVAALHAHMPELVPAYDAMVNEVGGNDPLPPACSRCGKCRARQSHVPRECCARAKPVHASSGITTIRPS